MLLENMTKSDVEISRASGGLAEVVDMLGSFGERRPRGGLTNFTALAILTQKASINMTQVNVYSIYTECSLNVH
jgi:hypothetical protein